MPTVTSSSHHIVAVGNSGTIGATLGGVVVCIGMNVVVHLVLVSAGKPVSHEGRSLSKSLKPDTCICSTRHRRPACTVAD
jgi:hypothetical protein